jgi:hypothetical protein
MKMKSCEMERTEKGWEEEERRAGEEGEEQL